MAKVFISYSQRDYKKEDGTVIPNNAIDKVTSSLGKNGIDYWIDQEGLDLGAKYAERIISNIKDCDTFLFLASRNANESEWTLREISSAISFGKRVLPVKLDNSNYADSIALYLSPLQYIDWSSNEEGAIEQIVNQIQNKGEYKHSASLAPSTPIFSRLVMYCALVVLTFIYAILTYQFLWAKELRPDELIGGMSGFACECGILLSVYYVIRILRGRKCLFIIPSVTVILMLVLGLLMRDMDILISSVCLMIGWGFLLLCCFVTSKAKKSFIQLMRDKKVEFSLTEAENLILLYLIVKVSIFAVAIFFGSSMQHPIISPWLF